MTQRNTGESILGDKGSLQDNEPSISV